MGSLHVIWLIILWSIVNNIFKVCPIKIVLVVTLVWRLKKICRTTKLKSLYQMYHSYSTSHSPENAYQQFLYVKSKCYYNRNCLKLTE